LTGGIISHYEVLDKLGEGGMGVSPDEHSLLYSQVDLAGSDLMVVSHFC
jgi:hypothetical protein